MIWREQQNHVNDCYFCMTNVSGFTKKTKSNVIYPNVPSAIGPVPHCETLPIPVPPNSFEEIDSSSSDDSKASTSSNSIYEASTITNVPQLFEQSDLDDLVRDLNLGKKHAEILGSRLQQRNMLAESTRITVYRKRHEAFAKFFQVEDRTCFCNDVNGLLTELGIQHNPNEWRLFIDSSKLSLKAVLLHNGNILPSVPLFHAAGLKETYETMSIILNLINYEMYSWKICGDLKVIGLLVGMQGGFTKYCCFMCLWDSRDREKHYNIKQWETRQEFIPGQCNVKHKPLVNPTNVLLPPLHIKLGLMKQFVKGLNRDDSGFSYLQEIFPHLTYAKLKEGIFVGPQIRKLLKDNILETKLTNVELGPGSGRRISWQ